MALSNIQIHKIQSSLTQQLNKYGTIAYKLKNCLDLHLHDSNTQNTTGQTLTDMIDSLKHHAENVGRLELRITIVAPMKAGKSTIINALIGDNVLPTRGDAMTTLPTEVVFQRDTEYPTLILTEEGVDLIIKLQRRICDYLKSSESSTEEILHSHSQLIQIANDISTSKIGSYFIPTLNTIGLNQIQKTLTFINDLVRLFIILSRLEGSDLKDVSLKPLLQKNIRLEVPAVNLHCESIRAAEEPVGCLTLVDTPGPNEAAASIELQQIVRNELRKAAIVLLVLNFTSMGTQADQAIVDEINSIRQANVNNDCIYVIVNKVDQRRKGDMSKDDVKKHIATKYQIEEKTNELSNRRIFEMKAVHCLVLRRFFKEKEELENRNQTIDIKKMSTLDEVTNELYKFDISDEEDRELEHIYKDARKMWKNAGFNEFVECAISDLIKKIAPGSLISALNICVNSEKELRKLITDHLILLDASAQLLEDESKELQKDCHKLTELKRLHKTKLSDEITSATNKLEREMEKASALCEEWKTKVFSGEAWRSSSDRRQFIARGTFGAGLLAGGILATLTILTGGAVGLVAGALAGAGAAAGASILQNNDNNKTFANETEAHLFIDTLRTDINSVCSEAYNSLRSEIDAVCNDINNSLLIFLKATTSDIIEKANKRLNESFKIELSSPKQFDVKIAEIDIDPNIIIQKHQPLWGYTLLGRKSKVTTKEEENNVSDLKLSISRAELQKMCTEFIEKNMTQLRVEIGKNFKEELEKTFNSHFDNIHTLFKAYLGALTGTLNAKNNDKEKQKRYREDLEMILRDLCEESKNVETTAKELNINLKHQ